MVQLNLIDADPDAVSFFVHTLLGRMMLVRKTLHCGSWKTFTVASAPHDAAIR